ncbi:hypothetical protein C5O22_11495 [Treponema sp. J25]|nr:hypothetical protein C5O22_11495 [Treponema sp. J25]
MKMRIPRFGVGAFSWEMGPFSGGIRPFTLILGDERGWKNLGPFLRKPYPCSWGNERGGPPLEPRGSDNEGPSFRGPFSLFLGRCSCGALTGSRVAPEQSSSVLEAVGPSFRGPSFARPLGG